MFDVPQDFIDDYVYETIEEGLYTSCPMCGTPLDWDVKYMYDDKIERHKFIATSFSCGYTFRLEAIWSSHSKLEGYYSSMIK